MKVFPLTLPIPGSGFLATTAPALCKAPYARDKHSLLPPSFASLERDENCPTAIYIRSEEEEDKNPSIQEQLWAWHTMLIWNRPQLPAADVWEEGNLGGG